MAISTTATTPQTPHLADPILHPFLDPSFTPAAYLNATLPPLHLTSTPPTSRPPSSVPLADLSTRTQTLLSQLNAQATRLSNALNQLTEEILRGGARLSYEVDVLRGEVQSLSEVLGEGIREDVDVFLPGGLPKGQADSTLPTASQDEPAYLTNLRTLTHVRANLDAVISLFGDALAFHLPPSLLQPQSGTSFISVSAPLTNASQGTEDPATLERKGQEYITRLREDLAALIKGEGADGDPQRGAEEARRRVARLREICALWKGTGEEKARVKFVDGLNAFVEEGIRNGEGGEGKGVPGTTSASAATSKAGASPRKRAGTQTRREAEKGSGFLENLRGIRGAG